MQDQIDILFFIEEKQLKNENEKLKSDLLKANKIISSIKNNQIDNKKIKR